MSIVDRTAPSGYPQNVTVRQFNESSVLVQWLPPPVDQRNGLITAYQVHPHTDSGHFNTVQNKSSNPFAWRAKIDFRLLRRDQHVAGQFDASFHFDVHRCGWIGRRHSLRFQGSRLDSGRIGSQFAGPRPLHRNESIDVDGAHDGPGSSQLVSDPRRPGKNQFNQVQLR